MSFILVQNIIRASTIGAQQKQSFGIHLTLYGAEMEMLEVYVNSVNFFIFICWNIMTHKRIIGPASFNAETG